LTWFFLLLFLTEAVYETPEGYLSVDYIMLIPLLIEALKQAIRESQETNNKLEVTLRVSFQ
jgi:transposase